jgi:subtilisin-like proprotein convertase family protein
VALICTAPAFAAEIIVRNGATGTVMEGCTVNVETSNARQVLPPAVGGIHSIDVQPGERIKVRAFDTQTKWQPTSFRMPVDLSQPVEINMYVAQPEAVCTESLPLAVPSVTPFSTIGAGVDPAVANTTCGLASLGLGDGLWFTVAGTGNTMTASTCLDADFDTQIAVYCDDCDDLTCVAGNDDGDLCGTSFTSEVSWASELGSTYAIYVTGFNGFTSVDSGSGNLTITDDGVETAATVSCLPPEPEVPTGACCNCLNEPFNCMIVTEEECTQMNGNTLPGTVLGYQGNDSSCVALGTTPFEFASAPGVAIPDGTGADLTSNTPAVAVINVPDTFIVGDVNVGFSTQHTWASDLQVDLQAPSGLRVVLSSRLCNGTVAGPFPGQDVIYDDEGVNSEDACVAASAIVGTINSVSGQGGSGNPTGSLAEFEGEQANGDWTLIVQDLFTGDVGSIDTFSLSFIDATPVCPVITPTTTGDDDDTTGDDDDDEGDDGSGSGKSGHMVAEGQTAASADGVLDLGFGLPTPVVDVNTDGRQRVDRNDTGGRQR